MSWLHKGKLVLLRNYTNRLEQEQVKLWSQTDSQGNGDYKMTEEAGKRAIEKALLYSKHEWYASEKNVRGITEYL